MYAEHATREGGREGGREGRGGEGRGGREGGCDYVDTVIRAWIRVGGVNEWMDMTGYDCCKGILLCEG